MSITLPIGKVTGTSNGEFVTVPDTYHYFKLYINKEYEVRPYIVYIKEYYSDFGEWRWTKFTSGVTKVLIRKDAFAKRVN